MISASRGSRAAAILRPVIPLAIAGTATCVLLRFSPTQYSFYPRCPFYEMLHLQCPGCGATRAIAALFHGRLSEAMRYNALITLLVPIAASLGLRWYLSFARREADTCPRIPQTALYVTLAAASIFAVLRNLPLRLFQ